MTTMVEIGRRDLEKLKKLDFAIEIHHFLKFMNDNGTGTPGKFTKACFLERFKMQNRSGNTFCISTLVKIGRLEVNFLKNGHFPYAVGCA